MDTSRITFGTDGWRAIIADGFTFESVKIVAASMAIAARELEAPAGIDRNTLVVSHDRRFLSQEFALAVAETLRDSGFRVLLTTAPTPSQTVSFSAWKRKVIGGITVTASHNPANYNGLKFKAWYGGSALPAIYETIAKNLGRNDRRSGGSIERADFLDDYVEALTGHVDVHSIRNAGLRILHDPIHGAAAGLPGRVIGEDLIETIRGENNPSFGGVNPEPIPKNLAVTQILMAEQASGDEDDPRFDLAICNDGDADRLGIVDDKGEFVSPHLILALLALYLAREKKMSGEIIKTFSTTRLVERIAQALGVVLHETPIGFKYVADLMLTRPILIGGEESGGLAVGHFLPERDGILSGLLVAEAVAHYGRPLSAIVSDMQDEYGRFHYNRRDLERPQQSIDSLMSRASSGSLDHSFGDDFSTRETKDGIKLNFADGTWLLLRKSGTEPIIRIYCESPSADRVETTLDQAVAALDRD